MGVAIKIQQESKPQVLSSMFPFPHRATPFWTSPVFFGCHPATKMASSSPSGFGSDRVPGTPKRDLRHLFVRAWGPIFWRRQPKNKRNPNMACPSGKWKHGVQNLRKPPLRSLICMGTQNLRKPPLLFNLLSHTRLSGKRNVRTAFSLAGLDRK